eukprot:166499-Chlamydomonas_euryale.AAC.2
MANFPPPVRLHPPAHLVPPIHRARRKRLRLGQPTLPCHQLREQLDGGKRVWVARADGLLAPLERALRKRQRLARLAVHALRGPREQTR